MINNAQNRIDPPDVADDPNKTEDTPIEGIMRAAIAYQRAMTNLVWSELQDASSRTSQPHIGSDDAAY
jgi:hypothetical protein